MRSIATEPKNAEGNGLIGRELDALVAEKVMGAQWLYWPAKQQRRLVYDAPNWNLQAYQPTDVLGQPDDLTDVRPYSTNLNYCALAEARVLEMGLHDAYDDALGRVMDEMEVSIWHPVMLKMASGEVRCRAMLKALEAQP